MEEVGYLVETGCMVGCFGFGFGFEEVVGLEFDSGFERVADLGFGFGCLVGFGLGFGRVVPLDCFADSSFWWLVVEEHDFAEQSSRSPDQTEVVNSSSQTLYACNALSPAQRQRNKNHT